METYVSLCDLERLKDFKYSWCPSWVITAKCYYAQATIYLGMINGKPKNTTIRLHNFLMNVKSGEVADHKNHDGLDNRRDNLRIASVTQNGKNRNTRNSNNKSGYRNVSQQGKWWAVQLQIDGVNTVLKKYPLDKVVEAGAYAELMREKYYGEYAGNN